MVEMVFKGISCESYEHRSQREIQLDPVFNFSFLLDGKGSDEVRTTHASAVHKSTTFSEQDAKSRATRRVALLIF
jgi:hypothetical protein